VGMSGRRLGDGPVTRCADAAWAEVLRVNLESAFRLMRAGLPALERAGGGSFVAVGSVLYYAGISLPGGGGAARSGDKLYYCPMHPQIVQDHPGECPICSMTLVPKPQGPAKPSASAWSLIPIPFD